jgi:hypothetical protein
MAGVSSAQALKRGEARIKRGEDRSFSAMAQPKRAGEALAVFRRPERF